MKYLLAIFIFALIQCKIVCAQPCIDMCTCTAETFTVNCAGWSLTEIPVGIPTDTKILRLNSNFITNIPANAFIDLPDLDYLELRDNEISSISANAFDGLSNLSHLDLRDNNILEISGAALASLPNLEILSLAVNAISIIPSSTFDFITNVKTIDISNNAISSLSAGTFSNLAALENLALAGNQLSSIPVDLFNGLSNLRYLDLGHNQLESINSVIFRELTGLLDLYLDHNEISSLAADTFQFSPYLWSLYLDNNKLSTLPSGLFHRLYFLTTDGEISLASNQFQTAPPSTYGSVSNLQPCHYSCWTCSGAGSSACTLCADYKLPVSGSCEEIENSLSSAIAFESAHLANATLSSAYYQSSVAAYFTAVFQSSISAIEIADSISSAISAQLLDPNLSSEVFSSMSAYSIKSLSSIESIILHDPTSSSPYFLSSSAAYQSSISAIHYSPASNSNSAPIPIIAGAASVAVIIILIAVLLLIRRRRQRSSHREESKDIEMRRKSLEHSALTTNKSTALAKNATSDMHMYANPRESVSLSNSSAQPSRTDPQSSSFYDNSISDNKLYEDMTSKDDGLYDNFAANNSNMEGNQKLRKDISIVKEIGSGQFGVVSYATVPRWWLLGTKTSTTKQQQSKQVSDACVKMLKPNADGKSMRDFIEEATMMEGFNHPNVVRVLANFVKEEPYMLVLEYMPYGDLHSLLKKASQQNLEIFFKEQLHIFSQVATGMGYLSSLHFAHRDLAARNCLVGETLTVKIADFGLSRSLESESDYYKIQTKGKLPAKWMAPESFNFKRFSTMSDVWSFGVLMWEVQHYGAHPYNDVEGKDLSAWLESGKRLPRAVSCTDDIHQLMTQIWSWEPQDRPTFEEIRLALADIMRQSDETSVRDLGKMLHSP